MNKVGLSDVIVTVLTILMVIMAVIIAWNFFQPVLNKIGLLSTNQFTTKLSVPQESLVLDQEGKQLSFDVKRDQGEGEITGFIFGLKDPEGNVRTFRQNVSISELELRGFVVNYSEYIIDDVVSISVTPIFRNNQTGLEQNGKPIDQKLLPINKVNKTVVTPPYTLPSGLVAHWKFDGNWVDSVNQLNAELNGNVMLDSETKKIGLGSVSFPGVSGNYLEAQDPLGKLNVLPFTILGWTNLNTLQDFQAIVEKPTTTNGYSLKYSNTNFNFTVVKSRSLLDSVSVQSADIVDSWHFVAVSYQDGLISIYHNSDSNSKQISLSLSQSTLPLRFGNLLNGNLDEMMFFSRALTSQEISDIRTKYK